MSWTLISKHAFLTTGRTAFLAAVAVTVLAATVPARAGHVAPAIEQRLNAEMTSGETKSELVTLQKFYQARGFKPAWIEHDQPGARARTLAAALLSADQHGLWPADYGTAAITAQFKSETPAERAELDVTLSRAVMLYGIDLGSGRVVPAEVDKELFIKPREVDPAEILATATSAADIGDYLDSLAPDTPQYDRLRKALAQYRQIAAEGGWGRVDDGPTLKKGMSGPRVSQLRARLIKGRYTTAASDTPEIFGEELENAVILFQKQHGRKPDGAVGKKTIAALNVPVAERIWQIELNMERRRWMPDDLGQKYIFVNLADFQLKVVDGPKTTHVARVVVGKPYFRTPVFSAKISYLVINPYWHVTPSIGRNEILPKIKKDIARIKKGDAKAKNEPTYLQKQGLRVFSDWSANAREIDPATVDWSAITKKGLRFKFRQDSGPGNALGRVKFMFPNRHNIYLHDTPSKSLFNQTVRSFSHGCIRVQNPLDLAELLLKTDDNWDRSAIDAQVTGEKRKVVRLKQSVPVHLTYLTAWANKDGSINFRSDIYKRDRRLADALTRSRAAE